MESELRSAVLAAADCPEACRAVGQIYDELMRQIAERRPVCVASGRCCRFEEFGHRLYVTTLELAKLQIDAGGVLTTRGQDAAAPRQPLPIFQLDRKSSDPVRGCPYQVDGLCGIHLIRPFGCRIFFCDATSTQWQHDLYERLHGQIRHLHEIHHIPYRYVEWRYALREMGWLIEA